MKPILADKIVSKKNGYQSDDDNVRYKINTKYLNSLNKSPKNKKDKVKNEDDDIRYKFPTVLLKSKQAVQKPKPKPKIKVNFWSNKQSSNRLHSIEANKTKTNRRHTIGTSTHETENKTKHAVVKVRKQVSFLPSPLFSENHVPMVTVPDDLTIQLNEEEANDLGEDLNLEFNNDRNVNSLPKRRSRTLTNDTSPKGSKRKRNIEHSDPQIHGNENELEFFSKYIVQKLRKMETNQRIYSENLINTVLMLGQLGKLNGKSKIGDA